ncbi:MAG: VWA domain-containing protein [Dethiobacter sp.]|nr:VWA domain-containing protein [Dethiobacter sp.]
MSTQSAGMISENTNVELQTVEKEIRRLQNLYAEKRFQRFSYHCLRHGQKKRGDSLSREAKVRGNSDNAGLAVPETMISAALRRLASKSARLVIPQDLRVLEQAGASPLEICLLVDTSGSMDGKRIREVKTLSEHLVSLMHEPLSLITFQEGDVGVKVRSTRNNLVFRRGLTTINALGLTPLGEGIRSAVNYMATRSARKQLVILITDGLPTWAPGEKDPYEDALEAAVYLKRKGMQLICIGLEPHRSFLKKLAECAEASLYIVDDLDHREMAAITRREKNRIKSEYR